jgi:hypothetical protein
MIAWCRKEGCDSPLALDIDDEDEVDGIADQIV